MKIRNGFVSNSSSSSFCIYGTVLEQEFPEAIKGICQRSSASLDKLQKWMSECCSPEETKEILLWIKDKNIDDPPDYLHDWDCTEILEAIFADDNIGIRVVYDAIYIGRSWKNVKDNETGKDFKNSVEEKIREVLGNVKCATHEEAWRDG